MARSNPCFRYLKGKCVKNESEDQLGVLLSVQVVQVETWVGRQWRLLALVTTRRLKARAMKGNNLKALQKRIFWFVYQGSYQFTSAVINEGWWENWQRSWLPLCILIIGGQTTTPLRLGFTHSPRTEKYCYSPRRNIGFGSTRIQTNTTRKKK
jgi:hypothetical protein